MRCTLSAHQLPLFGPTDSTSVDLDRIGIISQLQLVFEDHKEAKTR
jgi:hypothetical protein